jgi:hypothetical protein
LVKKRQQACKPDICLLVHGASAAGSMRGMYALAGIAVAFADEKDISRHYSTNQSFKNSSSSWHEYSTEW